MDRRIPFGEISRLVGDAIGSLEPQPVSSLDDVYRADQAARAHVARMLGTASHSSRRTIPAAHSLPAREK
jgi:1-deoxy-D-xylulose 5-phosphate reductoisomerase